MPYKFQKSPDVKDCCKRDINITEIWEKKDIVIYICGICGCKHRTLFCETGSILSDISKIPHIGGN